MFKEILQTHESIHDFFLSEKYKHPPSGEAPIHLYVNLTLFVLTKEKVV